MKMTTTTWVIIALIAVLALNQLGFLGTKLGASGLGSIVVKVVDVNGAAVEGVKVYMIPPDRGNPYIIMEKQSGYTEIRTSNSNGIADFGSTWNSSVSWSIGIRCTAPFNYSSNFIQYEPLPGSIGCQPADFVDGKCDLGAVYNVKITCPPNKRLTIDDMILGNHTITQEYVTEARVEGHGPVCFMDIYKDEACGDFNYGQTYYSFNADKDTSRGKFKQCYTNPTYIYGDCELGWTGIGDQCVSGASYFTNENCEQIKPGYVRVGNFCVAPTPTLPVVTTTTLYWPFPTTTLSGATTTTLLGVTTTTLPGGIESQDYSVYLIYGLAAAVVLLLAKVLKLL